MTASLHHLPVNPPVPDFAAGARVLASEGFDAASVLWIFAGTPELACPLATAMEDLAWSDPVTVARQWEAAGS